MREEIRKQAEAAKAPPVQQEPQYADCEEEEEDDGFDLDSKDFLEQEAVKEAMDKLGEGGSDLLKRIAGVITHEHKAKRARTGRDRADQ